MTATWHAPRTSARALALAALVRIEAEGAYANLVWPTLLGRSGLDERERAFATELVYGTTRMRRACDFLVDRFVVREPTPEVRAALRLGAYQLAFLRTPAHAAVDATVALVHGRARGFVNAVLRRVADAQVDAPDAWPDEATRLSYPDWIVARLRDDLGVTEATAALEVMNLPATVAERADGYIQDRGSQAVVALVGAEPGERVADVCAAPGGKATGLAAAGAWVAASDRRASRVGLLATNVARLGANAAVVVADARQPPWRPGSFDRVLVDAPCSGLGALRRRPDARWRIAADDVGRLATLQRELLDAAVDLVRPGGVVVYAACTLTTAESIELDATFRADHPELEVVEPPAGPWVHWEGAVSRLLPQQEGTDGMVVARYRRPAR